MPAHRGGETRRTTLHPRTTSPGELRPDSALSLRGPWNGEARSAAPCCWHLKGEAACVTGVVTRWVGHGLERTKGDGGPAPWALASNWVCDLSLLHYVIRQQTGKIPDSSSPRQLTGNVLTHLSDTIILLKTTKGCGYGVLTIYQALC